MPALTSDERLVNAARAKAVALRDHLQAQEDLNTATRHALQCQAQLAAASEELTAAIKEAASC